MAPTKINATATGDPNSTPANPPDDPNDNDGPESEEGQVMDPPLIPPDDNPDNENGSQQYLPPDDPADIVFADDNWPYLKKPGIPGFSHACIYIGNETVHGVNKPAIVQSDPHCELWDAVANLSFAAAQWEFLENHLESQGIGGVEYETLDYLFEWYTKEIAYGRVFGSKPYEKQILQFVKSRAVHFPEESPIHPFDYVSYWANDTKQVNGPPGSSGWKYYCAELVWAAYFDSMGLDLDGDSSTGHVKPQDIYDFLQCTTYGEIYRTYDPPDIVDEGSGNDGNDSPTDPPTETDCVP